VLRRQRLAVDRIHEEHLFAHRFGQGKASLIKLVDAALNAPIEPGEHDLGGAVHKAGLIQHRSEGGPRPLRRADRLAEPRLAQRPRHQASASVARALEGDRERCRGP